MASIRYVVSLFLLLPLLAAGQYSNPVHLAVRDGLPSSTIYTLAQDRQGFMWIGTEAGLVRYDGTNYKLYTTLDGLPDNEVLGVMADDQTDRLWIITYAKAACYYRHGKIYNATNDSSLRQLRCELGEFLNGDQQPGLGVFLYNGTTVYKCAHDQVTTITTRTMDIRGVHQWNDNTLDLLVGIKGIVRHTPAADTAIPVFCCDTTQGRGRWLGSTCCIFRIGAIDMYATTPDLHYRLVKTIHFPPLDKPVSLIVQGGNYIFSVPNDGVYIADTGLVAEPHKIWSGKSNCIVADSRGDIWIATSDDGIYVLSGNHTRSYSADHGLVYDNITAMYGHPDGTLYLGNSHGELYRYNNGNIDKVPLREGFGLDKVRAITGFDDYICMITSSATGYVHRDGQGVIIPHWGDHIRASHKTWGGGPKSLLRLRDADTVLVGMISNMGVLDTRTGSYREIGLHKRIIAMAQHPDGRVYCGSLDGLYLFRADTLAPVAGPDEGLRRRISSLCCTADGLLWIGTPSDGIIAYDGHRILAHLSAVRNLGYHGNICRAVVPGRYAGELWVATNDGVNKITYRYRDSVVVTGLVPLGTTDGLISNDINALLVRDSMIYVATAHGLTILNENLISQPQEIPVYIAAVRINEKDSALHSYSYELDHTQNNLRIEYIGVSLPAGIGLRYQYRLLGSGDDRWSTTTNTSIDFRSLSPGTYRFEVTVLDKFGHRSRSLATVSFRIRPAFYTTVWFWATVMISILIIGFLLIRDRFLKQQRRYQFEQSLQNKIIELEQQALKAQMNPHFIFNCLTAVQHFVNREDMYSANMYLSNFARLIRKTLDLSGEQYVSLDTEIAYLRDYIQMECLRFGDKFTWHINIADDLDTFETQVPPMLLQPIVENAIRHGLRNLEDKQGKLLLDFAIKDNTLYCTVDDNGIGRQKACELKTTIHVEYQSKGMSLTEMRIQAINQISDKKIRMEVKDKYDDNNQPDGTLFILAVEQ